MNIKISSEELNIMQMFEYLTDSDCLDCFIDKTGNTIFIIVGEGQVKKAIGKYGRNIKIIERRTNMKVKVIEYSSNLKDFVKNLIPNVIDVEINNGGESLTIFIEKYAKPYVLGRNRRNIEIYKRLLNKNFKVKEIFIK
ncbi:MAG: NusA-like transcription termination signal-binding factor [Candidatus Aenigmatarchaeota archaeon]